jgi:hypothetical protein
MVVVDVAADPRLVHRLASQMTNHQSARDAAADIAYPDVEGRSQYCDIRPYREPWRTSERHAVIDYPWRNWTDADSAQAIAADDARRTARTGRCHHCGDAFQPNRNNSQKYCNLDCYQDAQDAKRREERQAANA